MKELFDQIEIASKNNAYWVALIGVLTIPDICSSLESENGTTNKKKYIKWFDTWVSEKYKINNEIRLTGEICYSYRCAIIHQGKPIHDDMPFDSIVFIHPKLKGINMHMAIAQKTLSININQFVEEILESAERWYGEINSKLIFQKNYSTFLKLHPNGKSPIFGIPLIG